MHNFADRLCWVLPAGGGRGCGRRRRDRRCVISLAAARARVPAERGRIARVRASCVGRAGLPPASWLARPSGRGLARRRSGPLRQDYLVMPIARDPVPASSPAVCNGACGPGRPEGHRLTETGLSRRQDSRHRRRLAGRGPPLPPPAAARRRRELPACEGPDENRALRTPALALSGASAELHLLPAKSGPTGRGLGSPVAARALRLDTAAAAGRKGRHLRRLDPVSDRPRHRVALQPQVVAESGRHPAGSLHLRDA